MTDGPLPIDQLVSATFRANPDYRLLAYDALSASERSSLADLQDDKSFYGVVAGRPGKQLGMKAVCMDTARLVQVLESPGNVPRDVLRRMGQDADRTLLRMVLDGILMVYVGGRFVTGPAATTDLTDWWPLECAANNETSRLSRAALQYGELLRLCDASRLSARLYNYNCRPLTKTWQMRFADTNASLYELGLAPGGKCRSLLDEAWVPTDSRDDAFASIWNAWRRLQDRSPVMSSWTYKLYISMPFETLCETFGDVLAGLTQSAATSFKVARSAACLLRPDNMIAYFDNVADLRSAAENLTQRLAGAAAQGVPFTAGITRDGLLSWGMDPPRQRDHLVWQVRQSWRLWLTNRLGAAMIACLTNEGSSVPASEFALRRTALEGVDTSNWIPPFGVALDTR